jgi:hypothetical protein
MTRRAALRVGMLGPLGMSMGDLFRRRVRAAGDGRRAQSLIQINLPGGLAQQESWDHKPGLAAEYRGPFGVVKTKLPGEVFSENLPRLAALAERFTVVRKILDDGQASYPC